MKKCAIVNGSQAYAQLFTSLGYAVVDYIINEQFEPVDLVVFTGGEDVTPQLYGHEAHPTTFNSVFRDQQEATVFEKCVLHSIPMVGICRG